MIIQSIFYAPSESPRFRFTSGFVGALLTSLTVVALLTGCESFHGHSRSSLVAEWLGANGALGEYHTLTLGTNGDFLWSFRDEPLKVQDTYRGEWQVRSGVVHLLFTGGKSKTGKVVRPPHTNLALSILAAGQSIALMDQRGIRFEKATPRAQSRRGVLSR